MTAKERETHIRLEVDIAVQDSWTGETKFLLELLDAERERVKTLKSWIKAANQFAWAHEYDCQRREVRGAICKCGLDQFLASPRPFIESYEKRVQTLEDAAVEASSLAYSAKTHIGVGEYDIARDRALECYSILQRAIIADAKP